ALLAPPTIIYSLSLHDALPISYNTTADRLEYHPQGRDNGYVLSIDGKRVYIAGDTEDIPEMRALTDIDIAFVPMNLPFTMDEARSEEHTSELQSREKLVCRLLL